MRRQPARDARPGSSCAPSQKSSWNTCAETCVALLCQTCALDDDDGDGDARVLGRRDADEPLVAAVGIAARAGCRSCRRRARAEQRPPAAAGRRGARCRARSSRSSSRACSPASSGDSTRRGWRRAGSGSSRPLPSTTRSIQCGCASSPSASDAGELRGVERRDAAAGEPAAEPAEVVGVLRPGRRPRPPRARAPAPRASRSGGSRRAARRRRARARRAARSTGCSRCASARSERHLGAAARRVDAATASAGRGCRRSGRARRRRRGAPGRAPPPRSRP